MVVEGDMVVLAPVLELVGQFRRKVAVFVHDLVLLDSCMWFLDQERLFQSFADVVWLKSM